MTATAGYLFEGAQYDANSYFEVTGCHSGKRYRICHGTSMNI